MYSADLIPVFTEEKEREEFIDGLKQEYPTFREWFDYISSHHVTMIQKMKLYIHRNWKSVKDWGDYELELNGVTFTNTRLDSKGKKSSTLQRFLDRINSSRVNIEWIEITYDHHDSDISVAINDKVNWRFLSDKEVSELALYIEKQLKNEKENKAEK